MNPALSAFAARKSLQNQKTKRTVQSPSKQRQEIKDTSSRSISVPPVKAGSPSPDTLVPEPKLVIHEARPAATETASENIEEDGDSS